MIDTHAHIFGNKFEDIDEVVALFRKEGVEKVVMPNVDVSTIDSMLSVEKSHPETCFAAMGLHPTSVDEGFEKELYVIEDWLGKREFIAIGEIGTDLYWEDKYWEQQQEAFKIQCSLASGLNLPVIIHCRESIDETIDILEKLNYTNLKGVFHCFTGNADQANRIKELGFYLGIGGVVTFKNSTLSSVIEEIGTDQLVIETDSPYLAPVPNRGKRNTPANLKFIVDKMANALSIKAEELERITTENALKLFNFK